LQEHAAAQGAAIDRGTAAARPARDTAAGQRSVAFDFEGAALLDENVAARAKAATAAQCGVGIRRSAAAEATGTLHTLGVAPAAAEAAGTAERAATAAEPAVASRAGRRTAAAAAKSAAARATGSSGMTVDTAAGCDWTGTAAAA
jgi:hypothetical protein